MHTLTQLMKGLLCWLQFYVYFEDGSEDDWPESEDHVIEGNGPREPEGLSRS